MTKPKAYSYIRFSTPEQEKGDSLRRQIEKSAEYAKRNNLVLDNRLKLQDKGLSAFSGSHRTRGALGEFLKLVEKGKIPTKSILIVENLDRLSREQVLDALNQFTSIIQAGIKVVTLQDGMEYTKESINQNWAQLIISITYMARAHEESLTKSIRAQETWSNKRNNASNKGKKLTSRCPSWLEISKDKLSFTVLSERATVINRIFQMKLAGKGIGTIEKELNQDPDIWKPLSPRTGIRGWRTSYINKILRNRSAIGEYQPHKMVKGKRQPVGEPITDYYPPVIDQKIFDRVQLQLRDNKKYPGNSGGRVTKVKNLFTHLVKCADCGSSMVYIDKGPKPKGGEYLICDKARRNLGCSRKLVRYDILEPAVLSYCNGLDISEILPRKQEQESELAELRNTLQSIEGELNTIEGNINNMLDSIASTDSKELRKVLEDRASEMLERKVELEKEKTAQNRSIDKIVQSNQSTEEQLKDVKELIDLMDKLEGQERIELRLKLRNQLRRLLAKIRVFPRDKKTRCTLLFATGQRRALHIGGNEVRIRDMYHEKDFTQHL